MLQTSLCSLPPQPACEFREFNVKYLNVDMWDEHEIKDPPLRWLTKKDHKGNPFAHFPEKTLKIVRQSQKQKNQ